MTPGTVGNTVRNVSISIGTDATTFTYTGVLGSGVLLWQAQLETGSVATSPIVTTAGTASRVADAVSLTGASSLIGQTEGVVYAEFQSLNFNVPAQARRVVTLSDGTTDNRITVAGIVNQNNRYQGIVVNATTATAQIQQSSDVANNSIVRVAIAYKLNDIAFYVNGASIGTDTSSAVPACSRIDIGGQLGADQMINGWIRSVALFPTRLANATLVSLTTP
jgi:hypothetical protein